MCFPRNSDGEHRLICNWIPMLWIVDQAQGREDQVRKLIADGFGSQEIIEQKLEKFKTAEQLTDEEVVEWREAIDRVRERRKEDVQESAQIVEVQESLKSTSLKD